MVPLDPSFRNVTAYVIEKPKLNRKKNTDDIFLQL